MKKLMVVSSLFAFSAMAASMNGYISDSMCGAKHATDMNGDCVKGCVKKGAEPVFVSEGKVYKIAAASQSKVTSHLGEKVKVNGKVSGDTITIKSVSAGD